MFACTDAAPSEVKAMAAATKVLFMFEFLINSKLISLHHTKVGDSFTSRYGYDSDATLCTMHSACQDYTDNHILLLYI